MLQPQGRVLRARLALPLLFLPATALGSGFEVESQGARAMGFSGAYVAQAADASAIYYNAAGIGLLNGQRLDLGGQFGALSTDFSGEGPQPPEGTTESASRGLGPLPTVYYARPLGERAVVGVGVYSPFGFRSEWTNPSLSSGRFICTECRVRSWSVNPTLAYRLADRFSVGLGIDLRLSRFEQARRLLASPNPFPVPTDVAAMRFDSGTAAGLGWNVGVLASPSETVSLGLAYRHRVKVDHQAQVRFVQIPTGDAEVDAAVEAGLPAAQTGTASLTYPASFSAGLAVRRGDWTVEGDLAWTFWSSFDAVTLGFPQTPSFDSTLPQEYESTWRGAIGVEYLIGDRWEVRGGYSYDRSPQPAPTLSPFLHDEDRHGLALGGSYKHENLRVDLAGRLLVLSGRSTGGASRYDYEGLYQSSGFSLGVSFGYRF